MKTDLKFEDLGFPPDVTTEELKKRFSIATDNKWQLEAWLDAVSEEVVRRGG